MSQHEHALVWIDHREAKVFQFDAAAVDRAAIHSSHPHQHLHHKANSGASGHAPVDKEFLARVAVAVAAAGSILLTGPGSAKTELLTWIKREQPDLAARISAVVTLDHPSEHELIALARSYFKTDTTAETQRMQS